MPNENELSFDTHVCLVSDEAAANFLPAVSTGFKPKKIILVVTPTMKGNARSLAEAFRRAIPAVEIDEIAIPSPWDIQSITDNIVTYFDSRDHSSVVLNATGGTKLMMIGAYRAFEMLECPVFYFQITSGDILLLSMDEAKRIRTIATEPSLEHYLLAYGYIASAPDAGKEIPFDSKKKELCDELIKNYSSYADSIRTINFIAGEAEQKKSLVFSFKDYPNIERSPKVMALLEEFEKYGTLEIKSDQVRFASVADRQFVNGGWLESYAYDQFCHVVSGKKIAKNITLSPLSSGKLKNEIDVAFVYNNRLYLVECKTSSDQKKFNDYIYKMDSLGQLGGHYVRKILVSYQEIKNENGNPLERAEKSHIKIIQGRKLNNLAKELESCR